MSSHYDIPEQFPANVALLDREGRIVHVNENWLRFGAQNGLRCRDGGVGSNYLELCQRTLGAEHRLTLDLGMLLLGRTAIVSWVYPCHGPQEKRWFNLIGSGPYRDSALTVLAHVDVTCLLSGRDWFEGPTPETARAALAPLLIGDTAPHSAQARRIFPNDLTPRQSQVLEFLKSGSSNAEIAARLGVSESAVKKQVSALLARFKVDTRRALVSLLSP
jgi:DNA-binding CsgD family transcriptional regulator